MRIVELQSEAAFHDAFPVMRDLRTHLTESEFMTRLRVMRGESYRLVAVRDGGSDDIKALAGFKVMMTLHAGKVIHIYDLVTVDGARSQGYGAALMQHMENLARAIGCDAITLDSGLQRADAHRFYLERVGMDRTGYTFVKSIHIEGG